MELSRVPRRAPGTALLFVALLGTPALAAQEIEVPAADGWVTDRAEMLQPDEERALEALAESYQAGSGHEVALLTVPNLDGRPIEPFALEVFRQWGIGREGMHDGALLVVARDEHELRIEVGRGLEGTLTDSISGRIIRDVIVPEFKKERWYAGLRAGMEAIHAAAGGDYGPIERSEGGREAAESVGELLVVLFCLAFLALILGRSRRRRGGVASALPWILASQLGGLGGGPRSVGGFRGFRGGFGGGGGGGFRGFGGGGGASGGGASGRW